MVQAQLSGFDGLFCVLLLSSFLLLAQGLESLRVLVRQWRQGRFIHSLGFVSLGFMCSLSSSSCVWASFVSRVPSNQEPPMALS